MLVRVFGGVGVGGHVHQLFCLALVLDLSALFLPHAELLFSTVLHCLFLLEFPSGICETVKPETSLFSLSLCIHCMYVCK